MQVALIAEFEVAAKDRDKFPAAAKQELEAVRKNEPGICALTSSYSMRATGVEHSLRFLPIK